MYLLPFCVPYRGFLIDQKLFFAEKLGNWRKFLNEKTNFVNFIFNRVPCTVYRLPSTVYRLPSTVYRLPSTVYRLPSTVYVFHTYCSTLFTSCNMICFSIYNCLYQKAISRSSQYLEECLKFAYS